VTFEMFDSLKEQWNITANLNLLDTIDSLLVISYEREKANFTDIETYHSQHHKEQAIILFIFY